MPQTTNPKDFKINPHSSTRYLNVKNDTSNKKLPELYNNRENCCGCTACYSICPVSAITMNPDEEGFLCPTVDAEKCVRCYSCLSVCSFKEDQVKKGYLDDLNNSTQKRKKTENLPLLPETIVYAAKSKDPDIIMKSSSGGAFTALSDIFLANGDAVVCSSYDIQTHQQKYMIVENTKERDSARGSKFMQSIPGDIFKTAEKWLKENPQKKLLFVGVGCQAAGFVKYAEMKGFRSRVTIADIICHGSPSPMIWSEYAKSLENKYGKITYVTFKDKRNGWNKPTRFVVINGEEISIREYAKIFYNHIDLRLSCHKCPYTTTKRCTDLTIGDYWGIENKIPEFYDKNGVSLILIHTEKGHNIFEQAASSLDYVQSSTEDCLQPNLIKPTASDPKRDLFWQDYYAKGIDYVIHKYGNDSMTTKIKKKIKKIFRKLK